VWQMFSEGSLPPHLPVPPAATSPITSPTSIPLHPANGPSHAAIPDILKPDETAWDLFRRVRATRVATGLRHLDEVVTL
jgi:hypothetical protein